MEVKKRIVIDQRDRGEEGILHVKGEKADSEKLEEFEKVKIISRQLSESENIFQGLEKEFFLTEPPESMDLPPDTAAVELLYPVNSRTSEKAELPELKDLVGKIDILNSRGVSVELRVPILETNYEDLKSVVNLADAKDVEKLTFFLPDPELDGCPGELMPSLTRMIDYLQGAVDSAIMKDISVEVRDIPLCQMVGYKRYLERFREKSEFILEEGEIRDLIDFRSEKKSKTGQCSICKYSDQCPGMWQEYLEVADTKEIMPVTGKVVLTDNERCMVSILMEEDGITTKRILELKSSDRFKDICANCVGSDDVMVTGVNLQDKGVVRREMGDEGYEWRLNRESRLVQELEEGLS